MNTKLLAAVGFNTEGWSESTCKAIDREIRVVVSPWRIFLFERFGWNWPLKGSDLYVYQQGVQQAWQTLIVSGPRHDLQMDGLV